MNAAERKRDDLQREREFYPDGQKREFTPFLFISIPTRVTNTGASPTYVNFPCSITRKREYAAAFPEDGEEARWNCACWKWLGETFLVDPQEGDEGSEQLFQWYREKGITDIGREETDCQDANGAYIGKGPVGEIELVTAAANIARRLQTEGFIREQFGENVPILIHDLEYSWFDLEATRFANPEGQAEAFLKFWEA